MAWCLLCVRNNCWVEREREGNGEVEFVEENEGIFKGNGGDLEVTRKEVIRFVLREVLEVEREMEGFFGKKVGLCDDCLETGVKKAWEVKQEIKRLEGELKEVKGEIREVMRERVTRRRKRKRGNGGNDEEDKVVEEIGRLAFGQGRTGTSEETDQEESTRDSTSPNSQEAGDGDIYEVTPEDNCSSSEVPSEDDDDEDGPPPQKKCKKTLRGKKNTVCPRCSSRFKDPLQYQSHMDLHTENDLKGELAITCTQCQFPCRTQKELDWHIHNRHLVPSRISLKSCGLCTFQNKIWKVLKRHAEKEHPNARAEQLGPDVLLKCAVCQLQCGNPRAYHHHKEKCRLHPLSSGSPSEPISCPEPNCGILFPNANLLQFHVINTHKRQSQLCCETCGKGFNRREHLGRHLRTHNPTKRDFICHLCGMDYKYQFTLDEHYKKCHPPKNPSSDQGVHEGDETDEPVHKCRYCDLTSPFLAVIKRHLKTHKEANGHHCHLCDKSYVNSNGLRRHLQINHSEEPQVFKCQFCHRTYSNLLALQGHQRQYCSIKKLQEIKNENL